MAMDTTVINEVWKIHFDKLVRGFQVLTPEWKDLNDLKDFETISLREIRFPVDLRYGGGMAMTFDGGPTARAVSNKPEEATVFYNHLTGRFEVSYDVRKAENDSKFVRAQITKQIKYQMKDKLKAFQRSISIQFYGRSTGVLFEVGADATGPEFGTQDRYGITGLTPTVEWLVPNKDRIAILDVSAGNAVLGIELVTAVNRSTGTFTTQNNIAGVAQGDLVVLANHIDGTSTDFNRAMTGMDNLIADNAVHGIDKTVAGNEDWSAAFDVDVSGQPIEGVQLTKDFTTLELESGYAVTNAVCGVGAFAQTMADMFEAKRYGGDARSATIGGDGVDLGGGVKLKPRLFCPPVWALYWSKEALRKCSPDEDIEKVKTGGPDEFVYGGNYLGYFCDLVFRYEMTTTCRKGLGRHKNVAQA